MDKKTAEASRTREEGLRCAECGSTNVETRLEKQQFPYGQGRNTVEIEASVPVRHCLQCGFEFLDGAAESRRHEAVCRHLGVLTPDDIKEIREAYGLSRAEFSRLTRLGEATLTRWESAALIQNAAYDRYLRLLRFPENFRRLQTGQQNPAGVVVSMTAYRFRALKEEVARKDQSHFQLRKRVAG